MARITITIGRPTSENNTRLQWHPDTNILLGIAGSSSLFASQSVPYYFGLLSFRDPGSFGTTLQLGTSSGPGEQFSGPELNSIWETRVGPAIVVEAGSVRLELNGPDASGNDNRDPSEPYSWRSSIAEQAEITAFRTAYANLTNSQKDTTTLTLDDGIIPTQELSLSARAGDPTASLNLRHIPPPQRLSLSARAGNPTASLNLRSIAPLLLSGLGRRRASSRRPGTDSGQRR